MKISEIDSNTKFVDLENFFDVYETRSGHGDIYVYNLNSTVYFDGIPSEEYKLDHNMFWTTLSYAIYGTTRLWWALMKANNVGMDRAFEPVRAGETVRYVDKNTMRSIVSDIAEV